MWHFRQDLRPHDGDWQAKRGDRLEQERLVSESLKCEMIELGERRKRRITTGLRMPSKMIAKRVDRLREDVNSHRTEVEETCE